MTKQIINLPNELYFLVGSYSDPSSLNSLAHANKHFNTIASSNLLWEETVKRHFPEQYHLNKSLTTNFRQLFNRLENNTYRALSKENKVILRLLKEGDFSYETLSHYGFTNQNEFFKATIDLRNDLSDLPSWCHSIDVNEIAINSRNQALLDYYYQYHCTKYESRVKNGVYNPLPTYLRYACICIK